MGISSPSRTSPLSSRKKLASAACHVLQLMGPRDMDILVMPNLGGAYFPCPTQFPLPTQFLLYSTELGSTGKVSDLQSGFSHIPAGIWVVSESNPPLSALLKDPLGGILGKPLSGVLISRTLGTAVAGPTSGAPLQPRSLPGWSVSGTHTRGLGPLFGGLGCRNGGPQQYFTGSHHCFVGSHWDGLGCSWLRFCRVLRNWRALVQ